MTLRKFFVGGNWKMNGSSADIVSLVDNLNSIVLNPSSVGTTFFSLIVLFPLDVVVSPPFVYLQHIKQSLSQNILLAAQNCYLENSGAFTGEISPSMLLDIGIHWVILGHSERRSLFGESDQFVASKAKFAVDCGLNAIVCVGEKLDEREAGLTNDVVLRQLNAVAATVDVSEKWSNIVIAYEPVWAIGTGKVATPEQAQEVHETIRNWISKKFNHQLAAATRIIYGGSVNGKNCSDLASKLDIDGFLVGGASLKPEFATIVDSVKVKSNI